MTELPLSRPLSASPVRSDALLYTASRILTIVALAILMGYGVVYIAYAANLIAFPFDYDQGEGFELVDTLLFSQGELPYKDTDVYPFYSSNYPPLFHVMAAPFVPVFGTGYWYGRLLGFLGTLVTAGAIALAVYREGRRPTIALLAALAFLASNTVYHIGPLFRQHMTMVMFETLAVVVLAHMDAIPSLRRRRWGLFAGLSLVLAAGYTKQLALTTALAVFAFLFIRSPRRAIISGVLFGLAGGAIFLWLNIATDGQWWLQTISANVNEFIPSQTWGLYRLWFALHGFLIVPALMYALYELYFSRLSIYTIWTIAGIGVGVLSGKWGAGDSYFATSIAGICLLSGIFFARLLNGDLAVPRNPIARFTIDPLRRAAPIVAAGSLLLVPLCYIGYGRAVLHLPTEGAGFAVIADLLGIEANARNGFYDSAGRIAGGYADIGHFTTQADIDAGWRIVERVRAAPGDVLSEEAAFNLLADKPVIGNPTQLLNLANNGLWDPTALVALIEARQFGLIVLRAQFYPPDVLQAIAAHYGQDEVIAMNGFNYLLLVPKSE
ncbi:MAG: hypothetical protein SGJ24_09935 [Chloroflexota bacterium]|nr:hypothetical protein [Chloroflexota bacterium]